MRIFFNRHFFGHLDAADGGDTTDIVPGQIDQHDVLGDFFRIGQQFRGKLRVFFRCSTTGTRASQWSDNHFSAFGNVFLPDQNFRRRSDNVLVVEMIIIKIGRRIQRSQGTVKGQRRIGERFLQALCEHDLHAVAVGNVFSGSFYGSQKIFFFEVPDHVGTAAAVHCRCNGGFVEHGTQLTQALSGLRIRFRAGRVGINDQVELA